MKIEKKLWIILFAFDFCVRFQYLLVRRAKICTEAAPSRAPSTIIYSRFGCLRIHTAAIFIFLAASARTRIITSDFLCFDKELLYKNMVDARADWLYELPQWDEIFTPEKRNLCVLIHCLNRIRNLQTVIDSIKKYKYCCGKNA